MGYSTAPRTPYQELYATLQEEIGHLEYYENVIAGHADTDPELLQQLNIQGRILHLREVLARVDSRS